MENKFPTNTFLELVDAELENIQTTLNCPRSAMMYNIVKLKRKLQHNKPQNKIRIRVFAFDVQLPTQTLAVKINVEGLPQNIIVIFSTSVTPSDEMLNALENWVNWSQPNQFEGVERPISDFIMDASKRYGNSKLNGPIGLYSMDEEDARKLITEITNTDQFFTVEVDNLTPKDAIKVNSRWPAACQGSLEMLQGSIELVNSSGVYVRGNLDNENENEDDRTLVSWAIALPFGSIHALHTETEFQGRGLANLTMKAVSRSVAKSGRIPLVQIYKLNDASIHLNTKVGFKYSHDISLIHYHPY